MREVLSDIWGIVLIVGTTGVIAIAMGRVGQGWLRWHDPKRFDPDTTEGFRGDPDGNPPPPSEESPA